MGLCAAIPPPPKRLQCLPSALCSARARRSPKSSLEALFAYWQQNPSVPPAGTWGQSWSKLQPRKEQELATPNTFLPGNGAVGTYSAPPAHLLTSLGEAAHRAHSFVVCPEPRAQSSP